MDSNPQFYLEVKNIDSKILDQDRFHMEYQMCTEEKKSGKKVKLIDLDNLTGNLAIQHVIQP